MGPRKAGLPTASSANKEGKDTNPPCWMATTDLAERPGATAGSSASVGAGGVKAGNEEMGGGGGGGSDGWREPAANVRSRTEAGDNGAGAAAGSVTGTACVACEVGGPWAFAGTTGAPGDVDCASRSCSWRIWAARAAMDGCCRSPGPASGEAGLRACERELARLGALRGPRGISKSPSV